MLTKKGIEALSIIITLATMLKIIPCKWDSETLKLSKLTHWYQIIPGYVILININIRTIFTCVNYYICMEKGTKASELLHFFGL